MARTDFMRSLTFTEEIKTGTWSLFQPRFLNGVAPCMDACPASIDMPRIYNLLTRGEVDEACRAILDFNPFPYITSRICPQFCRERCNREELDDGVKIREIEGWLGEEVLKRGLPEPHPFIGKRALVVGSGPAGLSAAWYLAMQGVQVTIAEREETPGGILAWGIPAFRLERESLKQALEAVKALGVKIETSTQVTPDNLTELSHEFNWVIVATGLDRARMLPGIEEGDRVLPGLKVLKEYNLQGILPEGENVLVVGGGNVAVDVARVFVREGRTVTMACVEPEDQVPAIKEELQEALEEGVSLVCSVGLKDAQAAHGHVKVTMQRVRVVDESGPLKKVEFVGSEQPGVFNLVVLAVGQEPSYQWPEDSIITAGDLACGPSSVAQAIASGREAARRILCQLQQREYIHAREELWQRDQMEVVSFNDINPVNIDLLPSVPLPKGVPLEVGRCLSCGYCNACGTCWLFCPDASIELQQPPLLDAEHCKGCGICATECPRGVIYMKRRGF